MVIFVAVVVVVALGALVVAALMRPGGDDTSVRSYHTAIGTLEHLSPAERRVRRSPGQGNPDPEEADEAPGGHDFDPTRSSVPPVPVRGNDEFPDPGERLVFDDARPRDRYRSSLRSESPTRPRTNQAQRHALDSMNRRPRRTGGVVLVVLLIAAFAGLAYAGSRRSNPPARASSQRSQHAGSTSTTAAPSHHAPKSTTTTTPPTQIVALTSASNGSAATYPVANPSFGLAITTTGPVWVDVRTLATGSTLWTGTLQPGNSQTVQATGPTAVELGATGASLAVDGVPVVLPSDLHTPFVATFQPAATPASTTTSTP